MPPGGWIRFRMQGRVRMKLSWLKLDIGIYDDQKIKVIRKMPAGAELFMMWIGLLCLGMRGKTPGVIELDDGIPYSIDDLSNHFDLSHKTVQLALQTFSRLKMIDVSTGGTIEIINFRKHQSLENIEYQRERNRINVQKYREKQALLKNEQVKIAPVTDYTITSNRTDLDIDKEIDKNKREDSASRSTSHKKQRKPKEADQFFDAYLLAYENLKKEKIAAVPASDLGKAKREWLDAGRTIDQWQSFVNWLFSQEWFKKIPENAHHLHRASTINQWAASISRKPKVDLDRVDGNVQGAIKWFAHHMKIGDLAHARENWDYINKYPTLRDKHNFKEVRP